MDEAEKLEKKLRRQKNFDLEDFITALKQMRRMGSMKQLLNFIPGLKVTDEALEAGQNELKRFEAIVFSMTPAERREPKLLNSTRRQRIARGAGTTVQEINRFIEHFRQMQTMTQGLLSRTAGGSGMVQRSATKAKPKPRKKKR
jgi:signal recognition particle subunit SRP54